MNKNAIRALSHIRRNGVDDVFHPPLFHGALERELLTDSDYRKSILKEVDSFLKANTVKAISNTIRFNIPKSRYAYRAASWIELTDATKFLALVLEETPHIERARKPR